MSKEGKQEVKVNRGVFKEWLEQLQQESWQLELLISGFAIFGIYSARPFINELELAQSIVSDGFVNRLMSFFITIIKNGWYIFFINLIIHVVFRGLWIGAIGLRYVSDDIEYDELGYSDLFTNYLKKKVGSYDDFIEKLERLCSVIFAYTFLLVLFFISLIMFFIINFVAAYLMQKLGPESAPVVSVFFIIFFLLGFLVFIDFITIGGFKKIRERSVSKVYFRIYQFYSFITLSFLYRPLLYNFIDNSYTKKLFYLSIPYIFIVMFGKNLVVKNDYPNIPPTSQLKEFGLRLSDYSYDDKRLILLNEFPNDNRTIEKQTVPVVSIESFEVSKPYISAFIQLQGSFKKLIQKDSTFTPYFEDGFALNMFGMASVDDPNMEALIDAKTNELAARYDELRAIRKSMRKSSRKDGVSVDQLKDDEKSLKVQIDSIAKVWDDKIALFKRTKAEESLNVFMSNISFDLDGVPIKEDKCFYYNHPNFNEKGIKCFFIIDTISTGIHYFNYKKKYLKGKDEIRELNRSIPFMRLEN